MVDGVGNANTPKPSAAPIQPGLTEGTAPAGPPHTQSGQTPTVALVTIYSNDGSVPVLALPRNMDADVMMTLLLAVRQKQGQESVKTAEARVEEKKVERQAKHEEIMKKLKDMHDAQNKSDTGSKVAMAFGWIGVGLAWIAVGVVAVVSGGAAAVPLAIAATAMTALMICQQTGATDKAIEAMNLDDKQAMGLQIGLAAAMLVINIAACVMSGGAAAGGVASGVADVAAAGAEAGAAGAEAATTGAEAGATAGAVAGETAAASAETSAEAGVAGSEVATASVEVAGEAAESGASATEEATSAADTAAQTTARSARMVRVANRVRSAAQLAQAVPQAGGGAAQITTSDYRYQAAQARADAADERADMLEAQEITYEEMRRIAKLLEQMQTAWAIVMSTVDDGAATRMRLARTV